MIQPNIKSSNTKNNRGVSPVIGFLVIVIVFLFFISVVYIPSIQALLQSEEANHTERLSTDFNKLQAEINNNVMMEADSIVIINGSVEYSSIPQQTLQAIDFLIDINVEETSSELSYVDENADVFTIERTSERIRYEKQYNFINDREFVYEHTSVYSESGDVFVAPPLNVQDNRIILQDVTAESVSSENTLNKSVQTEQQTIDTLENKENVTLRLETEVTVEEFERAYTDEEFVTNISRDGDFIEIEFEDDETYEIIEETVTINQR